MNEKYVTSPENELIYAASEAIGFLKGISINLDDRKKASAVNIAHRLKEAINLTEQGLIPKAERKE